MYIAQNRNSGILVFIHSWGTTEDGFIGHFFRIFDYFFFCFVVALSDLVHDEDTIHGIMVTANSNWKYFLKIAVSQASLILTKRFPDAVSS